VNKKLIIIGIDGLDPELLVRWQNVLPNISKLMKNGTFSSINSVFPPDSIPAWTSIYTGTDPSVHGIIDSINYLDKSKFENISIDQSSIKGKTFWDQLSRNGKKVCIVNPFICYPSWDINGFMLSGPCLKEGEPSMTGEPLLDSKQIPHLGGIPKFPAEKEFKDFISFNRSNTNEVAKLGHDLYNRDEWDLFFIYFLTLDRVKHFLWRYNDDTDPTYPGNNNYRGTIKDFYIQYDSIIGSYYNNRKPDTNILIISDHGHQRRCIKVFNINEFFRQKKWLVLPTSKKGVWWKILLEKLKVSVLKNMDKYSCQDMVFKLVRLIPKRKALKSSSYIIDKNNSLCFASEFCSTNPAGGIELNDEALENQGIVRQDFIDELFAELNNIEDPETGEKVFEWVQTREDLYKGGKIDNFPPIIFNLANDYGVSWNLFTDLVTANVTHKKISGGHRQKGVFLIDKQVNGIPTSIAELYQFIVSHFNESSSDK